MYTYAVEYLYSTDDKSLKVVNHSLKQSLYRALQNIFGSKRVMSVFATVKTRLIIEISNFHNILKINKKHCADFTLKKKSKTVISNIRFSQAK